MTPTPPSQRVHICTSGSCNNNCVFCCDRDPAVKARRRHLKLYGARDLTFQGFKKESQKPAHIDGILFTGGEPTLNPLLKDFIAAAAKKGYFRIGLQTNGRRLKYAAYTEALLKAGLNEINVSLHGSNAKIHEAHTRSPGSFSESWAGLTHAVSFKKIYPLTVTVNFTVTKLNMKDIPGFLKKIRRLGRVDHVVLNTLMLTGNARAFFPTLGVSYRDLARTVKKLIPKYRKSFFGVNAIPLCLLSGQDGFRGISEQPLTVKKGLAMNLKRSSSKTKNAACAACPHDPECEGIDTVYARVMGWKEFPLPKNKALHG